MDAGNATRHLAQWGRECRAYGREVSSPVGLAHLLQVRLALSKAGPLVIRSPRSRWVHLRSLGRVLLRSHTSDISVLNELVVWDGYTSSARLLPSPATILDLGANTGLAARWFLKIWPQARLVAVEPEPGNINVLRSNLSQTGSLIFPVAVGGHARKATLFTENGEFGFTICGEPSGTTIEVDVTTMPDLLRDAELDAIGLLKVDIEGAERELFADCGSWIGKVGSMIVECHTGYTADDLMADCARGGGSFSVLEVDKKPEWGFEVVTAVARLTP